MIFRTKNGDLVNIVRSNFKTDTDYYLQLASILSSDLNSNLKQNSNNVYKSQVKNIEAIEAIISK